MPSLVDECILGKNKFKNFLEVVEDCGIKTGYDFIHFMSVTKEHCVDKGITDYDEVKKIWEEHKDSVIRAVDWIKDYDNLPDDLYYKDKRYLGNLYADKETYEWLITPSEEDDDVGYWQPDQVIELDDEAFDAFEKEVTNTKPDMERIKECKKIFEGIDKVEVDTGESHD